LFSEKAPSGTVGQRGGAIHASTGKIRMMEQGTDVLMQVKTAKEQRKKKGSNVLRKILPYPLFDIIVLLNAWYIL